MGLSKLLKKEPKILTDEDLVEKYNLDESSKSSKEELDFDMKLVDNYYETFNYNWQEIAEHFLFGDRIESVFGNNQKYTGLSLQKILMGWILDGGEKDGPIKFELKEAFKEKMENHSKSDYNTTEWLHKYFENLTTYTADLIKATSGSDIDINVVKKLAFDVEIVFPHAQGLYGNLVTAESKDKGNENYRNQDILKLFRLASRNGLVINYLQTHNFFKAFLDDESVKSNETFQKAIDQYLGIGFNTGLKTGLGAGLQGVASGVYETKRTHRGMSLMEASAELTGYELSVEYAKVGFENGMAIGYMNDNKHKLQMRKRHAAVLRQYTLQTMAMSDRNMWAFDKKYNF